MRQLQATVLVVAIAQPVFARPAVVQGARPFERHNIVTSPSQSNRRQEAVSCTSLLSLHYVSDFEESMKPCSCQNTHGGGYRIACNYDYCEHCVGSTCAFQQTVHTYSEVGDLQTGFACVSYTKGGAAGENICFEFGGSKQQPPADTHPICSVEVNGRQCSVCEYQICGSLMQPRIECGDALPSLDLCDTTLDSAISLGSPLAMFRADFTFASCYLELRQETLGSGNAIAAIPSQAPVRPALLEPPSQPAEQGTPTKSPIKQPTKFPTTQPSTTPQTYSSPTTPSPSSQPTSYRFSVMKDLLAGVTHALHPTRRRASSSAMAITSVPETRIPALNPTARQRKLKVALNSPTEKELHESDPRSLATSSSSRQAFLAQSLGALVMVAGLVV